MRSQNWRQMREGRSRGERWELQGRITRGLKREVDRGRHPMRHPTFPETPRYLRGDITGDWGPKGTGSRHSEGRLPLGHAIQSCEEVKEMENRSQSLRIGLLPPSIAVPVTSPHGQPVLLKEDLHRPTFHHQKPSITSHFPDIKAQSPW